MTAAFNIALPGSIETPRTEPAPVLKWTRVGDEWVRIPFIRDGKGDRPAIDLSPRKDETK